jgi:hypothetical protein
MIYQITSPYFNKKKSQKFLPAHFTLEPISSAVNAATSIYKLSPYLIALGII